MNVSNLNRGCRSMRVGSFADIRPALTAYNVGTDGSILAASNTPGLYRVITSNRFGETRVHNSLTKPVASAMVANLRKRGYSARYEFQPLI